MPLTRTTPRYARTHGPFTTAEIAARFGVAPERLADPLRSLESTDRIVKGEFRPNGVEREWCDTVVLRRLRRRSLAKLRHEVEPVEARRPGSAADEVRVGEGRETVVAAGHERARGVLRATLRCGARESEVGDNDARRARADPQRG